MDIGAQKIDKSSLTTYEIVLAVFQVYDKLENSWFFQEISLLINNNVIIILKMLFLSFNKMEIAFMDYEVS